MTSTAASSLDNGNTYIDLIRRGALQHEPRTAVVFGDETLTFGEVDRLSSQLANALHAVGATQGVRAAILLNNGLYSVPMDFACVKAGVNRVPLNTRLSLTEHARMIRDTGCTHLLFGPDQESRARELVASVTGLRSWTVGAVIDGMPDILEFARSLPFQPPQVATNADDVVMTLFTSGTTGTLKAAQHTQASYAAVCRNVLLNILPATREDAMLHAASMIHASGLFVLPLWVRGGRTVILPGFEPGTFLRTIARHRITAVNMVPTMMQMLL